MENDATKTLCEIYGEEPGHWLHRLLIQLQQPEHTLRREDVQVWANDLRFIWAPFKEWSSEGYNSNEESENSDGSDDNNEESESANGRNDSSEESESADGSDELPDSSSIHSSSSSSSDSHPPITGSETNLSYSYYSLPKSFSPPEGIRPYLHVTSKGELTGYVHYLAVSYCWQHRKSKARILSKALDIIYAIANAVVFLLFRVLGRVLRLYSEQPHIVEAGTGFRRSRAPREVIDRAMSYAKTNHIRLVWIDQECIDQNDRTDKEFGIQSMDLVYQRASHRICLLEARIETQAQLDALALFEQVGEPTLGQYEAGIEVLELIADDRAQTRAWIFQEFVASGLEMVLLLRYDAKLNKSEHLGQVPGEAAISIKDLMDVQDAVMWFHYQRAEAVGVPASLRSRMNTLIHRFTLSPSWNTKRAVESQLPSSGLSAFVDLNKRNNSRVPDKLAILGNLCNYSLRINTSKLPSNARSLSACAFALALINGDMSFLMEFAQNGTRTPDVDSTALANRPFSWLPHTSACFTRPADSGLETDSYPCIPILCQVVPSGLLVRGHIWHVNHPVHLPGCHARYSQLKLPEQNRDKDTGAVALEDGPGTIRQFAGEMFWSIVCELMDTGHIELAQVIWASGNRDFYLDTKTEWVYSYTPPLPTHVRDVYDPKTKQFLLHQEPYLTSEVDAWRLFTAEVYRGLYRFLLLRVIRDGRLWYGEKRSFFDVDGPALVISPHVRKEDTAVTKGSPFLRHPISWIAESTNRLEGDVRVWQGKGVVTGLWTIEDDEGESFVIA